MVYTKYVLREQLISNTLGYDKAINSYISFPNVIQTLRATDAICGLPESRRLINGASYLYCRLSAVKPSAAAR